MRKVVLIILGIVAFIMPGCQQEEEPVPSQQSVDIAQAKANKGRPKTMIWSDGQLYESVVTPAVFDGDHGNYDILFAGNFYNGIGLISESKPGDKDYNGGRWSLYVLKEGVTTDYSMATSDQDLNMDDFISAGMFFECPLLPRKQN